MNGTPEDTNATVAPSDGTPPIHNGLAVRAFRVLSGLSQKDLAELSGLRQPTISEIEGETTTPHLTTLCKIARALSIPVGAIVRDRDAAARAAGLADRVPVSTAA